MLFQEGDVWVLRHTFDELALPGTIRGVIAARIDGLDATRRRVLREVSVVGREFLYRLVRTVSTEPEDLDGSLDLLSAADLIREKSADPELEYVFKHGLTQEVAYDGLLRRDRQQLHERVGRAIEGQLGDRVDEFVETLAYHFQRSGQLVDAVGYLRRAGRRALERYSMIECHHHYQGAYQLLTSDDPDHPVDRSTRSRLLMETILEWATAHYYSGEYGHLHDLFTAHDTLAAEVDDDALRARWLAWRGNVVWNHDYDVATAERLLDEALDLSRRCGDPTTQAYALAWLTWVLVNTGKTARAVTLWPQLQAILSSVPDATDRRYVHIKGLAGAANALAARGDTLSARAIAQELFDLGTETGNRRASAMGHLVLVAVYQVLGDSEMVGREAKAAVACRADPIYVWLGEIFIAVGAVGAGRIGEARELIEQYRVAPTLQGFGTLAANYRQIAAMLSVVEGHVISGLREIHAVRENIASSGDVASFANIDGFVARAHLFLAIGELPISRVKNPGLVLLLPVAAKRARAALTNLLADMERHGFEGRRAAVEFDLGRLAKHQRRTKEARSHLEAVERLLADEPYAYLRHQARTLLADL
jgi:tetratricopeptide (TPR) repeat protein